MPLAPVIATASGSSVEGVLMFNFLLGADVQRRNAEGQWIKLGRLHARSQHPLGKLFVTWELANAVGQVVVKPLIGW